MTTEESLATELNAALAKYRAAVKTTLSTLDDRSDKGQIEGEYVWQQAIRLETMACEEYREALIRWNAHVRQQLAIGG